MFKLTFDLDSAVAPAPIPRPAPFSKHPLSLGLSEKVIPFFALRTFRNFRFSLLFPFPPFFLGDVHEFYRKRKFDGARKSALPPRGVPGVDGDHLF